MNRLKAARKYRASTWLVSFLAICALAGAVRAAAGGGAAAGEASDGLRSSGVVAPRCPVDVFRELLAMNAEDRKQFLSTRSPVSQSLILAKLHEYEGMPPDLRALRLRATELRWYLLPLMSVPATNRAPQLAGIPAETRALVEVRLAIWDSFPPEVQTAFLANTNRSSIETPSIPEDPRPAALKKLAGSRPQTLEHDVRGWEQMSESQKQKVVRNFDRFFDLTLPERTRTLKSLSEPEQRQLEQTLKTFENLSPEQRSLCITSFDRFARFSAEERAEFLANAERWKAMTPGERHAWKDLVDKLTRRAPIPPGLAALRASQRKLATNRN
jgi:hypothetical protein